jgi:predicted permease
MVDKHIMKGLAEVTANFLIPCLSVSEICKSFKIGDWEMWLPILIYCLLNVGLGYITGELISLCFRGIKSEVKRLVLIVCMFSNSTSMQLVYVESLAGILAKIIGTSPEEAKSRGYVVVLIYTIFVNFLRWSIGFYLMKPDRDSDLFNKSQSNENWNYTRDLSIKALNNHLEVEDQKHNQISDKDNISTNSIRSKSSFKQLKNENPCWKIVKEGMNMPFIAGVAAIIISSIPYVNTFFSDPNSYGYKLITGKNNYDLL